MKVLNKHIRWRKEKNTLLICDCKRMMDLKIPLKFEPIIKRFERGFDERELKNREKLLFHDFKKLSLLSDLNIRKIKKKEFPKAMKLLDNELKIRIRDNQFLWDKYKKFSKFFIGIFLDNEIIGIICGFPREDYLLISELAIDSKFHKKGFGKKLVETFERIGKKKYKRINVGAEDNAIKFYESLDYNSFLLIQYKKEDYSKKDFDKLKIKKKIKDKNYERIEVEITRRDLKILDKLRKKYPKAYFQYIFTKNL